MFTKAILTAEFNLTETDPAEFCIIAQDTVIHIGSADVRYVDIANCASKWPGAALSTKTMKLADDVDLKIAADTHGYVGSDVTALYSKICYAANPRKHGTHRARRLLHYWSTSGLEASTLVPTLGATRGSHARECNVPMEIVISKYYGLILDLLILTLPRASVSQNAEQPPSIPRPSYRDVHSHSTLLRYVERFHVPTDCTMRLIKLNSGRAAVWNIKHEFPTTVNANFTVIFG
ncbi:hypothetical protein C8J56DRAFT_893369 [Mycena floridula]|nr:hypothetical protein C8J56DRAFT_893369 [Mycena floridula]